MSPPSWATAGRTRVSINSLIWSMISASAGSSSTEGGSSAMWIPAALPGVNRGAPLTKWSSRASRTSGSRSVHETAGEAVTDTKSRPKNTPSTMPLSNSALASGDACALSASAKSRVPASITVCPGRNLRVAGLGVCSVRISISAMWSRDALRSRTKGWRAGDDPADQADRNGQADQRDPPFAPAHRLGNGIEHGTAGDHRLGQLLAPNQPVIKDCRDMQDDEGEHDLEPQLVEVARLVRRVGADQPCQRTHEDAVFILGDQAEARLDCDGEQQGDDAQRAERGVADSAPFFAQIIAHAPRAANEIAEPRG